MIAPIFQLKFITTHQKWNYLDLSADFVTHLSRLFSELQGSYAFNSIWHKVAVVTWWAFWILAISQTLEMNLLCL